MENIKPDYKMTNLKSEGYTFQDVESVTSGPLKVLKTLL